MRDLTPDEFADRLRLVFAPWHTWLGLASFVVCAATGTAVAWFMPTYANLGFPIGMNAGIVALLAWL